MHKRPEQGSLYSSIMSKAKEVGIEGELVSI